MRRITSIFSPLMLAGAILLFSACQGNKKADKTAGHTAATTSTGAAGTGRIVYVNIDTLNDNYTIVKEKQADFKKRGEAIQSEMESAARKFQKDYADFMQKAQSGGYTTQAEGEAAQKRLSQMQETFEKRKESLTNQLLEEQMEFNKEVMKRLDAFLAEYNADNRYDYILSYKEGDPIMYKNKALDITWDVIDGMNKSQGQPVANTAIKKK